MCPGEIPAGMLFTYIFFFLYKQNPINSYFKKEWSSPWITNKSELADEFQIGEGDGTGRGGVA